MGFNNNKPVYLQLADKLMDEIVNRRIPADTRLPSVREFAADNQVNVNTAIRAYEYLMICGIIYNRRGIGYYAHLLGAIRVSSLRRDEFMQHDMEYFFRKLSSFDMTPYQLSELYKEFLAKNPPEPKKPDY